MPAILLSISLVGCGASGAVDYPSNASPVAALHNAIRALENEPSYSLTFTISPGAPNGGTAVYDANIEKPDRISITGALNVIAIGSTGYFRSRTVHHSGESTNYMNDMLGYINILKRASSVKRSGDIYSVPTAEATNLLRMTGLEKFQAVTDVSYRAKVEGGLIRSVSVDANGPSSIAATTTVKDIGSAPAVTAPRVG